MERIGANAVREILGRHGIKLSKALGQHFLIDGNIPEKIVRLAGIDKSCGILEVGPGIGALTLEISRAAGYVTAVELDRRLLPILAELLEDRANTEVIHADALKLDLRSLVEEKMPGLQWQVCANLPYNITSPAISAFLEAAVFESITIMIQREVARRICSKPGNPEYGSFTVFVNYHSEPEILFDVSPDCFMPKPNVWSSVIKLKPREKPLLNPEHERAFFKVVRAAFAQRRKTLSNALFSAFGSTLEKGDITRIIEECGFDPLARGETMRISDFSLLSERFIKQVDENGILK